MRRHQAAVLLKQLTEQNLVVPSIVSLNQSVPGQYQLVLHNVVNAEAIKQFVEQQNLNVKKDHQTGHCIIYRTHP